MCALGTQCVKPLPLVFVLNENRQPEVADPEADTAAHILEAAENCPVSAITVVEEGTGETLFP